jgi:hypothetical protein
MPDSKTIKIPGLGPTKAKNVYLGGVVVAGAVIAWVWYRRKNAPVDDTTITDEGVVSPDGTAATGVTGGAPVSSFVNPITGNAAPISNAEWAQQANQYLVNTLMVDPALAGSVIGKYLDGQILTQAEANLINAARAYLGPVPVGNYPVRVAAATPTTPTDTTTTPTPTGTDHKYVVEFHRVGVVGKSVNPRDYVKSHSDAAVATPNNVETALQATMKDARNRGLKQPWPGGFPVYVTVVKKV